MAIQTKIARILIFKKMRMKSTQKVRSLNVSFSTLLNLLVTFIILLSIEG